MGQYIFNGSLAVVKLTGSLLISQQLIHHTFERILDFNRNRLENISLEYTEKTIVLINKLAL